MKLSDINPLLTESEIQYITESIGADFGTIISRGVAAPFDQFKAAVVKNITPKLKAWAMEMMNRMQQVRGFEDDSSVKYNTLHKIINNTPSAADTIANHIIRRKLGVQSERETSKKEADTISDMLSGLQF